MEPVPQRTSCLKTILECFSRYTTADIRVTVCSVLGTRLLSLNQTAKRHSLTIPGSTIESEVIVDPGNEVVRGAVRRTSQVRGSSQIRNSALYRVVACTCTVY